MIITLYFIINFWIDEPIKNKFRYLNAMFEKLILFEI